jgi:hypothetical protein
LEGANGRCGHSAGQAWRLIRFKPHSALEISRPTAGQARFFATLLMRKKECQRVEEMQPFFEKICVCVWASLPSHFTNAMR